MKVMHFAETLAGGLATYLNELLPYQCEAYERVVVCCPADQVHLIEHDAPNLSLRTFDTKARSMLGIVDLLAWWWSQSRQGDHDIIHLHSAFAGFIGRLGAPLRTRIVYCAHGWAHAMKIAAPKQRLYALVERLLAKRSDAIINISSSEADYASAAGIPASKSHLVHNGMRDCAWTPKRRDTQTRLLFVGRFDRQKGVDVLVDAMAQLPADDFALEVVGGEIIGGARTVRFPPSIVQRGWLRPADVRKAIADADIVVMPSRWEGFGFVAVEAMRAGRPVVASSVGGLIDVVDDGNTGVLVEPDSVDALVAGIRHAASLDIEQMGLRARERYERCFSAEQMCKSVDRVYRHTKEPR